MPAVRNRVLLDGAIDTNAGKRNRAVWVQDIERQKPIEGGGTAGG